MNKEFDKSQNVVIDSLKTVFEAAIEDYKEADKNDEFGIPSPYAIFIIGIVMNEVLFTLFVSKEKEKQKEIFEEFVEFAEHELKKLK